MPPGATGRSSGWLCSTTPLDGRIVEVHAGAPYVDPIACPLADQGARLINRLSGLRQGERQAWLSAGLIYAGLAGATRWPSGNKSSNTLWLRIAATHLGGSHELSIFRRTLGAILAATSGHDRIDETRLTSWMNEHLRFVAVPYADPDTLGRLEDLVLREIDPPFNLAGMPRTPLRARLSDLRRAHNERAAEPTKQQRLIGE